MDNGSLIEEVHGYVRTALPLMSKQHIPITPENYSVWYRYVSGADGELRRTIDEMLQNEEEFSKERNEALYRRFCSHKDENELRRLREDLQHVLRTILREVTELTGQTEEYGSFVSRSVNNLSEHTSIQEIKDVIGEIIDKTKTLGTFGKNIQQELKKTTNALEELKRDFEQVRTEVIVDFLTGIANRKAFDSTMTRCIDEAAGNDEDLSLLLIDIDNFKRFNDEFGHLVGDEVLKVVAGRIREMVKGRDAVARFGGEEFAVILPQTHLNGAATLAESIRNSIATIPGRTITKDRDLGSLTVSIGVAHYRSGESSREFIERCDEALLTAKRAGKDRAVTVSDRKR
jgi:diguanylate cyclase